MHDGVRAACELLGFDPLYVANEGKLVAVVAPQDAEKILARMKRNRYGTRCRHHRRGSRGAQGQGDNEDQTGRITHRGHAQRRAAASDLLTFS